MWPAWGYGLWAHLPGVCVRRALPLLGPVAFVRAALTTLTSQYYPPHATSVSRWLWLEEESPGGLPEEESPEALPEGDCNIYGLSLLRPVPRPRSLRGAVRPVFSLLHDDSTGSASHRAATACAAGSAPPHDDTHRSGAVGELRPLAATEMAAAWVAARSDRRAR